ncbi:MAG: 30S ribosomal protein S4 [Bdellovibrionota bacterium]
MSCLNESVCRLCRRENTKLFLKGDRCYTDKCAVERRPYPPGQHGQQRMKFSEFALQLREKQKTKRWYGVSEKQFSKYFDMASKSKELTGISLLKHLEARLDNVIYLMGFGSSRRESRQLISHNHIMVNGVRVNVAGFLCKKGDVVTVSEASRGHARIMGAIQSVGRRTIPTWLEVDHGKFTGTVKDLPSRDEITAPAEENMIVEYYSR